MELYKDDIILLSFLTIDEDEAMQAIAENGMLLNGQNIEFEVEKESDNVLETEIRITDIYGEC